MASAGQSLAFLDAGATVAITGRRPDRLAETLDGYPRERTAALPADVSDGRQVATLVADVLGRFGGWTSSSATLQATRPARSPS